MKKASPDRRIGDRLRRDWPALLVLLLAALLFLGVRLSLREERTEAAAPGDYVEYERGVVTSILSDSCFSDPVSDGAARTTVYDINKKAKNLTGFPLIKTKPKEGYSFGG